MLQLALPRPECKSVAAFPGKIELPLFAELGLACRAALLLLQLYSPEAAEQLHVSEVWVLSRWTRILACCGHSDAAPNARRHVAHPHYRQASRHSAGRACACLSAAASPLPISTSGRHALRCALRPCAHIHRPSRWCPCALGSTPACPGYVAPHAAVVLRARIPNAAAAQRFAYSACA